MAEVKIELAVDSKTGTARIQSFSRESKSAFDKLGQSGESAFKKVEAATNKASKATDKAATTIQSKFKGAFSSVLNLRNALIGFGALTIGRGLIRTIGTLEEGWIGVAKTTGMAGEELERFKDEIRRLSTEMKGIKLEEFQEISQIAGQLGIKGVKNVKEFTRVIGMVKVATNLTADQASTDFAKISNVMKEPIENLERMGSVMNELSNTTTALSSHITNLTQRMGGAASTIGLTTTEVMGISATLMDMGVQLEIGGTAMSQVFQKMLMDTERFARVAGLSVDDFARKIKDSPLEALKMLLERMSEMGKFGAAEALSELGLEGVRVGGVLLKLSGGMDRLEENLKTANDEWKQGTSLLKEYETASKGLFAEVTSVSNAFKIAAEKIGEDFLPSVKSTLPWITKSVDILMSLVGAIDKLLQITFDPWIRLLIDLNNKFADGIWKIINWLPFMGREIENVAKEQESLAGKTTQATDAVKGNSQAMADAVFTTDKASESLSKYAGQVSTLGQELLELAGQDLSEAFKGIDASTIADASDALNRYGQTVDQVYGTQIEILGVIRNEMEQNGAKSEEILGIDLAASQREMAMLKDKLGAYQGYYAALESAASSAYSKQKSLLNDLDQLERQRTQSEQQANDLVLGLKQKLMTETERYYSTKEDLQTKFDAAMELSGQARINALKAYQQEVANNATAVTDNNKIVVTQEQAVEDAIWKIKEAQEAVQAESDNLIDAKKREMDANKEWITNLNAAMEQARSVVQDYKQEILDLASEISSMEARITLSVDTSQAKSDIQTLIDSIPTEVNITARVNIPTDIDTTVHIKGEGSPVLPISAKINAIKEEIRSIEDMSPKITADFSPMRISFSDMISGMNAIVELASEKWRRDIYGTMSSLPMPAIPGGIQDILRARYTSTIDRMINLVMKYMEASIPKFEHGTDYVPKTGLALVHRGEKIIPASENKKGGSRTYHINLGGVHVTTAGEKVNTRELARSMARDIKREVENIDRRVN